jgi:hypothetical protein
MNIKELENYLSDFDNLQETGHFESEKLKDNVFYHKEMDMKEFLAKGREIIRQSLMFKKGLSTN